MHIEVFAERDKRDEPIKNRWHWHFRNKGRITADSEAFPSKAHAVRAAKAVVTAVVREVHITGVVLKPGFNTEKLDSGDLILNWDH